MTPTAPASAELSALEEGLATAAERDPSLVLAVSPSEPLAFLSELASRLGERMLRAGPRGAEIAQELAERSASGATVLLLAERGWLFGPALADLLPIVRSPQPRVKLLAHPFGGKDAAASSLPTDELPLMRSLPGMAVGIPADAPSARAAIVALAEREGPAYLRLPRPGAPTCTPGTFVPGRANELRPGSDLAIVAYGSVLPRALELSSELGRIGVSARVLDVASVKPFDEAAVLRAARDTGAVLCVEASPLSLGVGTLVAAMVSENHPVPVLRLGLAETAAVPDDDPSLDAAGLSVARMRDEAWELLRRRGKVE